MTVTRDKEFDIPSDSAPQAVWKPEYSTKSLGDVINDIDPNGKPEQLIAQVNIGVVDEGSFVISNIDWDPQTQTGTRSRRGQSRQPADRAPREPEPRKEPCNITLGMIEGLSADSGNLFWVVFHEITPIGYYGTNGLDESGRRNGPKLEGDVLETEACYLASAIINYGGRENVSQTVWNPSYINRGGGTTPQDIYNEAWNGRAGRPEEGINAHLNSTAGSNACLKLNIVYRAVTTGGVGLGGEYKWWRASSTRRFNKDRGDIRQGSTDFLTYNPATEQQQRRRRR